jgi:hypothetical protein
MCYHTVFPEENDIRQNLDLNDPCMFAFEKVFAINQFAGIS